ncbi:MAG: hypothetical protein R6V25_03650 [Desulfatiglandales bacterium]
MNQSSDFCLDKACPLTHNDRPVLDNTRLKEVFGYRPQKNTREAFDYFLACRKGRNPG